MNKRINKVRQHLEPQTAFLISNLYNLRYLLNQPTLFDTHFNGALLLSKDEAFLLADGRYLLAAKQAGVKVQLKLIKTKFIAVFKKISQELGLKKIFFEADNLTYAQLLKFKEELTEVEFVPGKPLVEQLRLSKDKEEIKKIKAACQLTDKVWQQILNLIKPDITEKELALEVDYQLRKQGADNVSFETIVAFGPNSASPHHVPTNRKLKQGDFVLLDMGAYLNGYCSDLTRTVVFGKATADQKDIFKKVSAAQKVARLAVKAGLQAQEVDKQVRQLFAREGAQQFFTHNLGHGVGLEVHEQPTLGPQSTTVLADSMVFTLEPGLYIEGFGGVRIEDVVLLTTDGLEILSTASRELIEL